MSVRLAIDLEQSWLRVSLGADDREVVWTCSPLQDSIYDWVAAVTATLKGQETRVVFVDEPHCLTLDQIPLENGRLRLVLGEHPDWPLHGDPAGRPMHEFDVRSRTFAGALLSSVRSLCDELGQDGYRSRWGYDYPETKVAELQATLRT